MLKLLDEDRAAPSIRSQPPMAGITVGEPPPVDSETHFAARREVATVSLTRRKISGARIWVAVFPATWVQTTRREEGRSDSRTSLSSGEFQRWTRVMSAAPIAWSR